MSTGKQRHHDAGGAIVLACLALVAVSVAVTAPAAIGDLE
jgi:hypothetical protein